MKILIYEPDKKRLEAAKLDANGRFKESRILGISNPVEAKQLLETDKKITLVNMNGAYCPVKTALAGLTQLIKDIKSA